jgi:glycosyltransferase involved in cell wall biosynthesis
LKILFLTNLLPYPLDNGGKIKTFNTLKALSLHHEVDLLAFVNNESDKKYKKNLDVVCRNVGIVHKVVVKDASKFQFLADYVASLFSSLPYVIKKFFSKKMKDTIIRFQRKRKYDLIYVNHLSMMVYQRFFYSRLLLDQQNVESLIFYRMIKQTDNRFVRCLGSIEYIKLKKFEKEMLGKADEIIALSQADKKKFVHMLDGHQKTINIIPIHVDEDMLEFHPMKDGKVHLLFMGTMSWYPNKEGITWFLKNCFVHLDPEKYYLYICGSNPSKEIMNYQNASNITVTGYVADINVYISECEISIVPLFIGSGQRVKIIESFARGLPVISTSIGAEGLVTDQNNILIADTPEQFLKTIKRLADQPLLRKKIKNNARLIYEKYYSKESLSRELNRIFQSMGEC